MFAICRTDSRKEYVAAECNDSIAPGKYNCGDVADAISGQQSYAVADTESAGHTLALYLLAFAEVAVLSSFGGKGEAYDEVTVCNRGRVLEASGIAVGPLVLETADPKLGAAVMGGQVIVAAPRSANYA